MQKKFYSMIFAAGVLAAVSAYAQSPAGVPDGSTGLCKDGSYYSGASKQGACSGHKGVKTWYGPAAVAGNVPAAAAVGGQVWVNTRTKVYHCPSDKYYGKTKQGAYMTEADAKAKGFHADAGKVCH